MTTVEKLRNSTAAARIREQKALIVHRKIAAKTILELGEKLSSAGFTIREFTMDSPHAMGAIRYWDRYQDLLIGAGTVETPEQVYEAVHAGASYVVTYWNNHKVIEAALKREIIVIPGCKTPTEIREAWHTGATFIKLYPGGFDNGAELEEFVHGPLSHVQFVVAGGVTRHNAGQLLKRGAAAVAFGATEFLENGIESADQIIHEAAVNISLPHAA
ncbi:MAG: hypothetical protein A3I07_01215 [Candidatus Doudnabacteria bacterium RIFCSPLOWO2_02_FULL_42_9]|uniref:2-dehydro-3-deoxyphosphogluconate aldolase n=1 Tax=Candidatus Doudnabacteria bacterium RIFCSPHIGHO2_01_FULL_41_86 TaxID=1817821 RepID=A0A1F5N8Y8_9BACT|nr:MAG: hypothetical protein A2717_00780 [Candidatus Doudnabacteria bacterium RIFCSPHIGHO2_01_FULL_41_86]OGE75378.1 MAG: hypothetical protein A3K07_01290 [Candidatus Doudnabacteria bacterium RIFCSPHIGHO2_01_43_10]OGE86595.1 MAG: hypothetical protein A3E28_04275 [Candidatus Doudnabacteria bacterium RIFCSPHIGHO2_12_FULL_42_22]OGE87495.1 MAG: hypothetical protein A3C49_03935 [Candidatus Doudnabacteria bacterium RIFCSPHIGHO2_02_FULL_42_25]OGE92770.1 MAG: hypothetical protein A2895_04580 [Candidatus